jgi:hypothetical protein
MNKVVGISIHKLLSQTNVLSTGNLTPILLTARLFSHPIVIQTVSVKLSREAHLASGCSNALTDSSRSCKSPRVDLIDEIRALAFESCGHRSTPRKNMLQGGIMLFANDDCSGRGRSCIVLVSSLCLVSLATFNALSAADDYLRKDPQHLIVDAISAVAFGMVCWEQFQRWRKAKFKELIWE